MKGKEERRKTVNRKMRRNEGEEGEKCKRKQRESDGT